jgi:hypothetical protein
LLTNANEVQQYDIIYENHVQMKINDRKNETLKCSLLNQNDECIPYGHFFSQMIKLNNEQRIIVHDIVYKYIYIYIFIRTLTSFFNMMYKNSKNIHTYVYYTNPLQYYMK